MESKILSDIRLPQLTKKYIKSSMIIITKFQYLNSVVDSDLHQSEKVEASEVHFDALESPNLKKVSGRIRIRIKLKCRIRIRNTDLEL